MKKFAVYVVNMEDSADEGSIIFFLGTDEEDAMDQAVRSLIDDDPDKTTTDEEEIEMIEGSHYFVVSEIPSKI